MRMSDTMSYTDSMLTMFVADRTVLLPLSPPPQVVVVVVAAAGL
jgi:hypothetical protein